MADLKPIRADEQPKAKPLQPAPKPAPAPAAKPLAPAPKPAQPTPAPAPKPLAPAPAPKPVQPAPAPKPIAPAPKPIAPAPKPIAPAPKPIAPAPKPAAKPLAPKAIEKKSEEQEKTTFKFRCPACQSVIETTADEEFAECASCGKKFKNPKYNPSAEPQTEEKEEAAAEEKPADEQPEQQETSSEETAESAEGETESEPADKEEETEEEEQTQPEKTVFKFRCPACQSVIEATSDQEFAVCASCGKTFKNPRYVPETTAEPKPLAPAPKPLAPAPKPLAPAPIPAPVPATETAPQEEQTEEQTEEQVGETNEDMSSRFVGHSFKFIMINILNVLQLFVTLGLGTPWTQCRVQRWRWSNTIINGKRMTFDGKGSEIFGKWFGWTMLTILTLGVYSFWKKTKMEAYFTAHIHVEGEEDKESVFTSEVETYAGATLLSTLITLVTFGFGFAAAICRMMRWKYNHKIIGGRRLVFDGKKGRLFGKVIVWGLLIAVTFSIAMFFMPRQWYKWITKNMHFEEV